MAFNILSYIRDNIPYHYNKPWSFKTLRMLAQKDDYGFKFMKAFFTRDMSELENDEGLIGIVYKEAEPTGNDIPDNLKKPVLRPVSMMIRHLVSLLEEDIKSRLNELRFYPLNHILKEQSQS